MCHSMHQTRYESNATEKNTASIPKSPTARMLEDISRALPSFPLTENVTRATMSTSFHFHIEAWEVRCQRLYASILALVLRTVALRLKADEALCYLEPVLIDTSSTGVTSINYLSDAAYALILQCAVRESKGGIATGIGTLHASKIGPSGSSD